MAAPKPADIDDIKPAALKDLYNALWWITRAAKMKGPLGTTVYFISDENMAAARAAVAKAEGKPNAKDL